MKRTRLIIFVVSFVYLFFIFQSPLTQYTSGIVKTLANSFDELTALSVFLIGLSRFRLFKEQAKILGFMAAFLLCGLLGTVRYHLQPLNYVLIDIVSCSEFFLTLFGIIAVFNKNDIEIVLSTLHRITIILSVIFFFMTVLYYTFRIPFFIYAGKRYGINSLYLFYYHPALVAQVMVLFLAILGYSPTKKRSTIIAQIMCVIMLCLTLRAKAISFGFIYFFIVFYQVVYKSRFLKILLLIIVAVSIYYISAESIQTYYYSQEDSARGIMTKGGFQIANSHIPFGSGFATYGTSAAVSHYSPLYVKMGFQSVYGLGYIHTNFATDTFWPAVVAQFGYAGLVVFVSFLLHMFRFFMKSFKNSPKIAIVSLVLFMYLIVASTSGGSFFAPVAVPYGLLIGMCMRQKIES